MKPHNYCDLNCLLDSHLLPSKTHKKHKILKFIISCIFKTDSHPGFKSHYLIVPAKLFFTKVSKAGSGTVWNSMQYWHFLVRFETIPPVVFWVTPIDPYFKGSMVTPHRVNTEHNACKCSITRSMMFNAECTRNSLSTGLCPHPPESSQYSPDSLDGSGGGKPRKGKGHKG